MNRMKKLFSILLTACLLAGLALQAVATPPPLELPDLPFPLPKVTGIEAVWNGGIEICNYDLVPYFYSGNVDIKLVYEEGKSDVLTDWDGRALNWHWNVRYGIEYISSDTLSVTFYYEDSFLQSAYTGAKRDWYDDWYDWQYNGFLSDALAAYVATLPHTTITVPHDFVKRIIDGLRPLSELKLGKPIQVTFSGEEYKIFAFTPKICGTYMFYNMHGINFSGATLANSEYKLLAANDTNVSADLVVNAQLKANETCYLIMYNYSGTAETDLYVTRLSWFGRFTQSIFYRLEDIWTWKFRFYSWRLR